MSVCVTPVLGCSGRAVMEGAGLFRTDGGGVGLTGRTPRSARGQLLWSIGGEEEQGKGVGLGKSRKGELLEE
eukprot:3028383-Rhodomonas_salina.2